MDDGECRFCEKTYARIKPYHPKAMCYACRQERDAYRALALRHGAMDLYRARWLPDPRVPKVFEEMYGPAYRELSRTFLGSRRVAPPRWLETFAH